MPSLLGGQKAPPTPAVAVAPPMPDAQAPQVTEAQNAAALTSASRAGRQSTVLGKQAPPTAADTFSSPRLGSDQ